MIFERKKIVGKIFVLALLFLFFINFISAVGITPGREIINYEPGFEKEYSFNVINSEGANIYLDFEVSGEISQFIEFDVNEYYMRANEESKSFKYKIKLPNEEIFYPGGHEAKIIVRERETEEKDNNVGANMGVAIQIILDVPYLDKYLEVYPKIISEYEEGPVVFLIGAKNKGKIDIENAKSIVQIFDSKDKLVAEFETSESAVASGERVELKGEWSKRVQIGNYKSVIITDYDGTQVIVEKQFSVGTIFLEIEKITTRKFNLGEIAILDIFVRNKLNDNIDEVYVKINVYEDGKEIGPIATAPYDLEALATTNLVGYWDTAGVKIGEYPGRLTLGYSDGRFEEDVIVKVYENDIIIESLGNIKKLKRKLQIDLITVVNFILIIIILVISATLFRKIQKKSKKKKDIKKK